MPDIIGELRRNQLITTFSTGAIVDLSDYSVMVSGLDFWPASNLEYITESRLQRFLDVSGFRQPRPSENAFGRGTEDGGIPCMRFPRYVFCSICRRLAPFDTFGGGNKGIYCERCREDDPEGARLVPTRFVLCCRRGHIDDFPWQWWIGCNCERHRLIIKNEGVSTSLSSIIVSCDRCEAERTMADVFNPESFRGFTCSGGRPWLKDEQPCDQPVVVLQRSATSVHFPNTVSAISIPPYSKSAYKKVEELWGTAHLDILDENTVKTILNRIAEAEKRSPNDLWEAYLDRKGESQRESSVDLKEAEYSVLKDPIDFDEEDDFVAEPASVPSDFSKLIETVVLVKKLRVVTALTGFNRIEPNRDRYAPIKTSSIGWLPATEVLGEGIFLALSQDAVKNWLRQNSVVIQDRVKWVESRRKQLAARNRMISHEIVTPEFILLHSLSHLLIRTLTINCGYSTSALQERIYAAKPNDGQETMLGLLIFTAASDSEGSLGGLVQQGKQTRFESTLLEALEQSRWCSSDPLCIESKGQGMDSLNLGACHSCALLPETACETMNSFLDRGIVTGTPEHPKLGYFSEGRSWQ